MQEHSQAKQKKETKGTNGLMHLGRISASLVAGRLSEMQCPPTMFASSLSNSKPVLWLGFPLLEWAAGGQIHTCSCQMEEWEWGADDGQERKSWDRHCIAGANDFLSQLPKLRIITSCVGGNGLWG